MPLFHNTEVGFTKQLALSIKPVLFLSKEYVVRKGDIGSEVCVGICAITLSCLVYSSSFQFKTQPRDAF